jgi:hypothetical protein
MDEILETLFDELCKRIKECKEKNPLIDMDNIERSCILIKSYINKDISVKEDPSPLPYMSYEEVYKLIRLPRITPKGHLGPAYTMIRYAEEEDNKRARRVDYIIQYGKKVQENTPFF